MWVEGQGVLCRAEESCYSTMVATDVSRCCNCVCWALGLCEVFKKVQKIFAIGQILKQRDFRSYAFGVDSSCVLVRGEQRTRVSWGCACVRLCASMLTAIHVRPMND
jgi:hypothetical protein